VCSSARLRDRLRPRVKPDAALQSTFSRIYAEGTWTDALPGMPRSGRGSLPEHSSSVIEYVRAQIGGGSVGSIADIGCGDLTYIHAIPEITSGAVAYTGFEIVPELVEEHRRLPFGTFHVGDVTAAGFRVEADLVLLKDVLFHLEDQQVAAALDNLRRSQWRRLLITSSPVESNAGRSFDRWHFAPLNLERPPWSLRPEQALERVDGGAFLVFAPEGLS
jgi:hypothetical protein